MTHSDLGPAPDDHTPVWQRPTEPESKGPVTAAIIVAIALTAAAVGIWEPRIAKPGWVVPALATLMLIGIVIVRINEDDQRAVWVRRISLVLVAVMSVGNASAAVRLVLDLVNARGITDPGELLLVSGAIWLTNVILFALWYWEFDRGGAFERARGTRDYPDFLFPQMATRGIAGPDWEPFFVDYFYLSFTNATAFSPTDVMPLKRWAKMAMLAQSAISLVLVVLVVARAVNILGE